MEIAAVQWTSLQDFPDRIAAVVWAPGCNLRCPFCYNADLVLPQLKGRVPHVPPEDVVEGLRERRFFLDGVVITGGEPTLRPGLADFLRAAKQAGLAVKLDTNGTRPTVLHYLLEERLIDYVALDVKAPREKYSRYARPPQMNQQTLLSLVERSLSLLRESAVEYEFRTTAAPGLTAEDLESIARWIAPARRYSLQPFVVPPESRLVDEELRSQPALAPDRLREVAAGLSRLIPTHVRA